MAVLPCTYVRAALRAMQARHARVLPALHLCAGRALCYADDASLCLPCTTPMCGERFALRLCRLDMHVSALSLTYVLAARCTLRRDTPAHVSAPPHTYVQELLRPMQARHGRVALRRPCVQAVLRPEQARHARVSPVPHPCAGRTSCYAGETRTCPPCPAPMCWNRIALCRRDTHVSALPRP